MDMFLRSREVVWAFVGNVVVGFGAGTATISAFAPSLPVLGDPHFLLRSVIVSVGFAFFFAGYHITQAGTYRNAGDPLLESLLPTVGLPAKTKGSNPTRPMRANVIVIIRGVFILLGVLGLGAGMRLFAMTIESWDPLIGLISGIVCISGYICGHIGLNWVLL